MKKRLLFKKILNILVVPLVFGFLLFVHEPVVMYGNNIDDFWFDIWVLLKHSAIMLVAFLVISLAFLALFEKIKDGKFFHIILGLYFACFLICYIHSNYLAGFLPSVNGATPDWSNKAATISSVVVCIAVLVGLAVVLIKLKPKKSIKMFNYLSLAVFAMLLVSLVSVIVTKPVFAKKDNSVTATDIGINKLSKNKNILLFMIDTVDSRTFYDSIVGNEEYKESFKDFTYYSDAMSGYAYTRESLPFIFSGEWYENNKTYADYTTSVYDNSKVFNKAIEDGYESYLFSNDIIWNSNKALSFKNIAGYSSKTKTVPFMIQETKYLLFKVLPFPLKRFSKIETMNFLNCKRTFDWLDTSFRNNYIPSKKELIDSDLFQLMHLEGGHVPYDLDKDGNLIDKEKGTYKDKIDGVAKITNEYLDMLKNEGVYDNSAIVIMADHGYCEPLDVAKRCRLSPALYIKGINEHHHAMKTSNKQISQLDYADAIVELMDGSSSTELFSEIGNTGRSRRALIYDDEKKGDIMVEYIQNGHAWDEDTLTPTGNKYEPSE